MYSNRLPAGFLPLFSPSLLVSHFPYTSSAIHTQVSILKSELNKSVSLKGRVIIPYLILFLGGGRGVWLVAWTKSVNLPWKLHREVHLITGGRWLMLGRRTRKVTASCQQQKDSFSCKAQRRSFESIFWCDKSENLRGHRGDVSASLLLRKSTGVGKERDTIVLTPYELDLWEELLKWKLHWEKDGASEEGMGGFNKALRE